MQERDSHLHVARYCHIIDQANSSSRTRRNEEEEEEGEGERKRRRAQPERPSPTGEEDEEEGKGPDHLAGEGEKGRCNRLMAQWTRDEKTRTIDKAPPNSMEAFSELVGGDQNDQTVQPLATNQNDQVVQPSAVDQNDQVVQPPADEIKKARKRARRMEYLDRKNVQQKVEDAERQLEEMKADFAGSEKDHACSIAKLDQAQEDLELSTGALRPLQQIVEQQNSMISMLQQVLIHSKDDESMIWYTPVAHWSSSMEGQSEVVGGEQNNQTVQPLVADENDQNVKSKADGKKKAKSPGTDKKCREKKKRKTEDTEKQLEETRSQNDELEKVIAFLIGKLDQAEKDRERQNATQMNHDEMKNSLADLLMGKVLDRAQKYGLTIGGYMERQQVVEQSALTDGGLTHGGDLINNISPPRAAMASGSSLMQEGLLALGGQPVAGRTGFGIPRPFDFYHPATGSTLELGSPNIQELLCPSHEVERAHPGLTYGGLTYDGDLNYTSLLGAAMASGSLPMHGSLAPGGQIVSLDEPSSHN
ncbi:hypothetical protein IMY05_014G0038700 [Salix suchowensis]|nr:hypothetical protein IMY05_014G0038700 [Salix suchowensis]